MNSLKTVCRRLWSWGLVSGWWLAVEGIALAKMPKPVKSEPSGAGDWVFSYFLVILSIGLGMLIICRTSRRSDRARPEKYEDREASK